MGNAGDNTFSLVEEFGSLAITAAGVAASMMP